MKENENEGRIRDVSNYSTYRRGCGIVSKLTAGCGMKNRKLQVTDVLRRTETMTRAGLAGQDAGSKKTYVRRSYRKH